MCVCYVCVCDVCVTCVCVSDLFGCVCRDLCVYYCDETMRVGKIGDGKSSFFGR